MQKKEQIRNPMPVIEKIKLIANAGCSISLNGFVKKNHRILKMGVFIYPIVFVLINRYRQRWNKHHIFGETWNPPPRAIFLASAASSTIALQEKHKRQNELSSCLFNFWTKAGSASDANFWIHCGCLPIRLSRYPAKAWWWVPAWGQCFPQQAQRQTEIAQKHL